MMPPVWFSSLTYRHALEARVRWQYRCEPDTPADARTIAAAIENLSGVTRVRVNPRISSMVVSFDPQLTTSQGLAREILLLDPPRYLSGLPISASPEPSPGGVIRSLAILLGMSVFPLSLQLPVALWAAVPVLAHGAKDFQREKKISSHVLEAIAVAISLVRQDYLAANTTSFMLALGEYLEDSIARRSDDMLKALLKPVSSEVWIERDGVEVLIPATDVAIGDTVVVGAGAVVPVDGTVLGGEALLNEAAMTGESAPVAKTRGDLVLSGTHVEEGRLRIYAEHVGHKTAAARIADYVEQSLTAKSQVQLQASQLADQLVPYVLGLAGVAYGVSGDWQRSAAVLQADYSCALKLATPVAFKSAMFGAGEAGILVKGATALEKLAEADTFIFDKTGTLTSGSLEVTDSITFDANYTADELIWLAASVEEHYFHPLAMAVVSAAKNAQGKHFDHTEVQFIVAHGVASEVDGKRIVIGSRHFVEEDEGIAMAESSRQVIDTLYRSGKTLLYIGFGGQLIGVLALKDQLRDNSAQTIARLRGLGAKRILLLTGDHRDRAAEMAQMLGLDGFHAELLPHDKARIVQELTATGASIAFIGDGINDAPALAGAHVGIAMQKGADIARISADIALLEDNIARIADAKALANATMRLIASNYRMTIGLNTGILGAAALGLLTPITASVLHNGTTIGILLNALRGKGMIPRS